MNNENKIDWLNILVFLLTIYVLGALVADTFFDLTPELSKLLTYLDYLICFFFLIEFFYRFYKAEDKLAFIKWGWIDLLSSIPMLDQLRGGRVLRLIRLFRLFRAFRSTKQLITHIFADKIKGTLSSISIFAFLLIIFSSIAILQVEDAPTSNIKTAEDAVWWTYSTITTVGYGDKYPVTTEGRILAMILMTFGVGLFGTFTAYIASIFVTEESQKK